MKTNKSYTKRLKITGTGKTLARKPGQNHFNSKESGKTRLQKKRTHTVVLPKKDRQHYIPYN